MPHRNRITSPLTMTLLLAMAGLTLLSACSVDVWSDDEQADTSAIGDAERGKEAIQEYGCATCHTIPGIRGADATVGPPLTAFGERDYIAGELQNTPENLVRWIRDPQDVEPGTAMPNLGVTEDDAQDIAAYLEALD